MPTYDYECCSCDSKFELFHGISDDNVQSCPECGKENIQRLITPGAGIIFKGTGFYQTDYKNKR